MDTSGFDYDLPEAAIAQTAIEPRDASRLLVTATLEDRVFRELPSLLEPGDLLVVNRTRVRAARLRGHKIGSGGAVEVLLTRRLDDRRWEALTKPARRVGIGTRIDFGVLSGEIVAGPQRGVVTLELTGSRDPERAIEQTGEIPLPPYFHGNLDDDDRYQTVFASTLGSAAAPTAALHFTPSLVESLLRAGVTIAEVELEIGIDTFRPMAPGPITDHVMHSERYVVPEQAAKSINTTRSGGGRVVAVGTTVVRSLESASAANGTMEPAAGATTLFIKPGYDVRSVDSLITNFHAPRTSLLALVATLMGDRWRIAYDHARRRGYRFLSFGDAMYIDGIRS